MTGIQTDLWRCNDSVEFARLVGDALSKVAWKGRVTAGDVRARLVAYPAHCNWFGTTLRNVFRKRGYRVVGYHTSGVVSRRGGVEAIWERG